MRYGDEDEMVKGLKDQITLEKDLENARIDLALKPDFNLMDAFKLFDWDGKGWITLPEFREGLNDLGVVSDYDTVGLLFKRYDRNGDHKIRYSEFADAFTPSSPEYAERLSKREP